ncbi:putative sugar-binding transport protein [Clostridia bacterium]|nr:putative sugar-binding transport protein [Clostridia bacterium]
MQTEPAAFDSPIRPAHDGARRFMRVNPLANALFSILFILLAVITVAPLVFVIIISFSSEASINQIGYSFVPLSWGVSAYKYLWAMNAQVVRAFLNSLGVTLAGTALGLILTSTMGYVLSRRNYFARGFFTVYIFIPMLFSGGLVSTYVVNTQLFGLMNSYFALILPLACSTFYTIILRTFFQTSVPDSIIESGKIDGASQFSIYLRLVLPISLPGIATIGLFLTFAYWNDWYQALLYIRSTHPQLYTLQFMLVMIERGIDFLTKAAAYMSADSSKDLPSETMRMAIVVVAVLPIACSYPFFQKYFISGLTIGAVKG